MFCLFRSFRPSESYGVYIIESTGILVADAIDMRLRGKRYATSVCPSLFVPSGLIDRSEGSGILAADAIKRRPRGKGYASSACPGLIVLLNLTDFEDLKVVRFKP